MKHRKKVLFVITGLEYGGAETQLWQLCRVLRSRGWQTPVVSMIPPGPVARMFRDEGIPLSDLGMKRGVPSPLAVLRLARLVRAEAPALVHSHLVHANLLSRVASLMFPAIPVVNSGHNVSEGPRWRYYAYRYTDRLCDRFHTVSERALDGYVDGGFASREKLLHIPNGISFDLSPVGEETRRRLREELRLGAATVLLSVGRLDQQKNQPLLLRAFAALDDANALLLIAGEGPLREELEALRDELGLADRARFLGARDDIPALMAVADALVLSSSWEGLPIVVLEAGAASLPVIATAVGDVPSAIANEETGLLVPPEDLDALSGALRSFLARSSEERAALGRALREVVLEQYEMTKIVDRWEAVYAELCEAARG